MCVGRLFYFIFSVNIFLFINQSRSLNAHIDCTILRVKLHSGDIVILCGIFKECELGYHAWYQTTNQQVQIIIAACVKNAL